MVNCQIFSIYGTIIYEMWRRTSAEIRWDHYRKHGFMPGFEAIVAGKRRLPQPSFLDRARAQCANKGR